MSDDASLDEFLGGGSDGDDESDGEAAEPPADDESDGDDAAPATATATWHPDGAACAACGAIVERRWRDGERFVCGDCKEW